MGNGDPQKINTKYQFVPPQPLRFFDEGRFRPHQNLLKGDRDPVTSEKVYVESGDKANVGLFVRAWEYRFLGFIPTDRHLLGFSDIEHNYKAFPSMYLLGSDDIGRDQWSRLMLTFRNSLGIGAVGLILGTCAAWVLVARWARLGPDSRTWTSVPAARRC